MGGPREEDRKMKIPALIHLTRLGYRYLPREAGGREPETNLITEACRGALAEINGKEIADGEWQGLREALAMTGEQFGRVKAARVDPLEEQARIGDSGAAAAARAQLEAALGRRGS